MGKESYWARFIQKNGDPVEKQYSTKAAAIRAIKNAHRYYSEGQISQFVAWVQRFDDEKLTLVFEVINNKVMDRETNERKTW